MRGHPSSRTDYSETVCIDTSWGVPIEVLKTLYRAQRFSRHFHDTFTIGLGLRGDGTIWYRGRDHFRAAGDVVVIPPGEVHTGGVRAGARVLSYMALYLPDAVFAACAYDEGCADVHRSDYGAPVIQDDAVAGALRRLHGVLWPAASGQRPHAPSVDIAEDAIHMVVATLLRRTGSKPSRDIASGSGAGGDEGLVRTIREVLQECYGDRAQTSLRALAQRVGVSPFHMVRRFTRATGLSPHHYLLQIRVNVARNLLASGRSPSIVAAMAGFVDQSHLTVHFKRFTGMTPARYQRCLSRRAGSDNVRMPLT